ncbi:MAG: HesA/MoeB/ThiF family protein [Candidatus Bathyarchaeia archaeon]
MQTINKKTLAATYYSRQTIMKELGIEGQEKLAKAKVAIVGLGGLGTASALYLALSGVGHLKLIDQDTVEPQNLHRQILYTPKDLHYPKAEIAAKRLRKLNPFIKAEPIPESLNPNNAEKLLTNTDCIVDGLDNMQTRYIINQTATKLHIPYIFGAAIGMEGNISVFTPPNTPCLECVLPNLSDNNLLKCDTRGVLSPTPGIIGTIQAMETIKTITGIGATLKGKLMICDFNDMTFTTIDIKKRPNCPTCQQTPTQQKQNAKLIWLCGANTANINPEKPLNLNLTKIYQTIKQHYTTHKKTQTAIIFKHNNTEITLFNNGRILIKNTPNEQTALNTYKEIQQKLNLNPQQTT